MKKKPTSATVEFFRTIGAKNIRSHEQLPDALRAKLPELEANEVIDHLNAEKCWGNLSEEDDPLPLERIFFQNQCSGSVEG